MEQAQTTDWYSEDSGSNIFNSGQTYYDAELTGAVAANGSRWASLIGMAALFVLGCWIVLSSVYIILHDDLLATAIKERIRMQSAYEDRIAGLRGEIGAVTGRLMLNQDEFDAKVERLNTRQAMLEERQKKIAALIQDVDSVALAIGNNDITGATTEARAPAADIAATGNSNMIRLAFANQMDAETVSRPGYDLLQNSDLPSNPENQADRDLVRLAAAQYQLESDQFNTLNRLERRADSANMLIADAITQLGYEPHETFADASAEETGIGGPLIQIAPQILVAQSSFERQIKRIRERSEKAGNLYRSLLAFPIRAPLDPGHPVTSRFGSRVDPFRRTPAHHSGVDFRARRGTPVHATADGTVVMARRNAGYGRMVEVVHANGLSTRYAHMSRIDVRKGQKVKAGDIVGRVGSTGRSTGPHLHYETRRNGTAVNPAGFLEAGAEFIR